MANSTTGIMPAPLSRHHDVPQQLTPFDPTGITMMGGLYRLNDIHVLAGNHQKQRPVEFFRSEIGQSVLSELEREFKGCEIPTPYREVVIGKGKLQGTFVCREIVIAYAMWISPVFLVKVIRLIDRVVTGNLGELAELHTLTSKFNYLNNLDTKASTLVSNAGYILVVGGKQLKPLIKLAEKALLNQIQLSLPFTGE